MSQRYYLKPSEKPIAERIDKELVYCDVSLKFKTTIDGQTTYKKFAYSLGVYVMPQYFGVVQTKNGKSNYKYDVTVLNAKKHQNETAELRQAILTFEDQLQTAKKHFINKGERPAPAVFKAYLDELRGRKEVAEITTLSKYIAYKIKDLIKNSRSANGLAENTISNYKNLLSAVNNYDTVRKERLTFQNIKDLHKDLWDVTDSIVRGEIKLPNPKRKKPINKHGIASNTILGYQHSLKEMCQYADSEGVEVSTLFENKKLRHKAQKSSRQYEINNEDLLTIYNHKPSTNRLQTAKDYIIFSSLTGMRLQSVLQVVGETVKTYNKDGHTFKYVHTYQAKTQTSCHTPLFRPALEVIERNGGRLPNFSIYSGTINDQIKDLYREAGLTYEIKVTKHYHKDGAITTIENVNDVVSSHCTRKGFVTNLDVFGVDTSISQLVTHPDKKDNGTADSYNKITDSKRAVKFYKAVLATLEDNPLYRF